MNLHLHIFLLLTCINIIIISITPAYSHDDPVRIGVLAFRPKPQTLEQWQPLATALKQSIPEHNFVIQALTYPEMNKAVTDRQLDFVLTNPAHFIQLKKHGGLSAPLATLAVTVNGQRSSVFGGAIFCRATQSDINTLKDIKDKTIAVPDAESLGGYLMQAYELHRVGVHLPEDAKLVMTGMPHDNVIKAVLDGRAEVGFVRSGVLEGAAREGKFDIKQLKLLNLQNVATFPQQISTRLYPEWAFTALSNTDENIARHVAAALFKLEENSSTVRLMHIHGFSVPADYTPVEELLREMRFPPFDIAPHFSFLDVWNKYKWQNLGALLAIILATILGFRLLLTKRKLEDEKQLVLLQSEKLQESEAHLRTIIETEPECIKQLAADGSLLNMNRAGLDMIEADSLEQVINEKMYPMILPEHRDAFIALTNKVFNGESGNLEFEVQGLKGRHCWLESHAVPLRNSLGQITSLLAITRDITERKQHQKMQEEIKQKLETQLAEITALQLRLQEQAVRDPLTGLNNRRYLDEILPRELSRAKREGYQLALIMLDLDYFKKVNDTYGHAAGDEVLKYLSSIISNNARESDIICRYGGEEFIVVLPRMPLEHAMQKVEAWRLMFSENPVKHGDLWINVTLSAGISEFPQHGSDDSKLIALADEALYKSKKEGRNRVNCACITT